MHLFNTEFGIYAGTALVAAFALGAIIHAVRGAGGTAALRRGLATGLVTLVSMMLARLATWACLAMLGGEDQSAALAGWLFGLWPGLIDTAALLLAGKSVLGPEGLMWFATIVGTLSGFFDGLWATHNFKGLGWLSLPLDTTWGLSGTTNGVLLHLVNFAWADHADEPQRGVHRYRQGFRFKSGFAFTQGAVMSGMDGHPPDTPLHDHEHLHVWQNRWFGPFFTISYLGWMAIMLLPALLIPKSGVNAFLRVEWLAYYNNPWELWAYSRGGYRDANHAMAWSVAKTLAFAVPFFCLVIAALVIAVLLVV